MKLSNHVSGLAVATAAAALFALAPLGATADEHAEKGHCVGANACKGQGACAGADHACAGKNACKGQGFTLATKEECDAAGGTYEAAESEAE